MQRLHLATALHIIITAVLAQDIVQIKQGYLRGHRLISRKGREIFAFQGIPYAKAPIGELRFQPPQPPEKWIGILNATHDGPECLQKPFFFAEPGIKGQEDCLYLNVYTPSVPRFDAPFTPLPVLFWIHGGGWVSGSGGIDLYGPQYLLDTEIILVTINYRLGPLGFLSTGDSVCPGNNGLKDQVAALRWVRDNIEAFGGNPKSITIFGESAGGASVHFHMLSPTSQGLFHRAISQSGTATCPWALASDDTKQQTVNLGNQLGCPTSSSVELISCLRSRDALEIINSLKTFEIGSSNTTILYGPTIETDVEEGDEAVITMNPVNALLLPNRRRLVPWMVGLLSGDGAVLAAGLFAKEGAVEELDQGFEDIIPTTFLFRDKAEISDVRKIAREIRKFYFGDRQINSDTVKAVVDMYTDALLLYGTDMAVKLHSQREDTVYYYYFDYRGTNSYTAIFGNPDIDYGVCHFDELQYLFPQDHWFPNTTRSPKDDLMVDTLTTLWTEFARSGNPTPSPSNFDTWKPVSSPDILEYAHIDSHGLRMDEGLLTERAGFWTSLFNKLHHQIINKDEL